MTGGAGFIGSNLCEAILNIGYRVRCLDDLSTGKQSDIDLFLGVPLQEMLNTKLIRDQSLRPSPLHTKL